MAHIYPGANWGYMTASSATTLDYTTIGTTWDSGNSAPRGVVWNGYEVRVTEAAPVVKEEPENAVAWLRRRIEEVRCDLAEAA